MAPTHWEEALDASAVSRPGTTQYEPGPTWEAWEDELREEHEYDDWESKLQASAKRDPAMRPGRVTTVDVMVREALVSGLGQDEAIARAAAAPPPPSPFHPPYKGLGMVPRDRAPKREEDWWDHDDIHPDAHRAHGGANAETATYADGSPRKPPPPHGRSSGVEPGTGSFRSPKGKTLDWKPHALRDGELGEDGDGRQQVHVGLDSRLAAELHAHAVRGACHLTNPRHALGHNVHLAV